MRRLSLLLVVACSLQLGCSGDDEWSAKRPKVYRAGGVVKLDGQPLEGAVVVYHSQEHNISAQGKSDEQGRYTLTTFNQDDGAASGQHKVVVTKRIYKEVKTKFDSAEERSVASIPKDVLPLKYATPTTTTLEATVNSSGSNQTTLELQSK